MWIKRLIFENGFAILNIYTNFFKDREELRLKKFQWTKNPYICGGLTLLAVTALAMVFYRIISDLSGVGRFFSTAADVLMPFIVGLALAYLLAPVYNFVRRHALRWFTGKKSEPTKAAKIGARVLASAAALVVLIAVIGGLMSMVIPQAISSVANLIQTLPERSQTVVLWVKGIEERFAVGDNMLSGWLSNGINWITVALTDWVQKDLLPNIPDIAKDFSTGLIGAFGIATNVLVGVIICVYTLNSKELFAAQAKKVLYALFKIPRANYIIQTTRYVDHTFGRYINGMLIDALMVGMVCFIACSILRIPYALLISAIVGLFNIVPIFGPITAAVIGTFFVLLEDPLKAFIFLVLVIVLQQVDGNIIAPKILGEQTGLSSFWVIFAIVVGGGFFGVIGMILGVPAFAVIYMLIRTLLEKKLRKKHVPVSTQVYHGLWELREETGEPVYEAPAPSTEETE